MNTRLSNQQRQKIWQLHQSKSQNKKLDPHLKRNLKHGWLFPYLVQTDNLLWGRWQYWGKSQLLPDIAWQRWKLEKTIAFLTDRKPKAIPDFVVEQTLPDGGIPQITWNYNEQAEKMLIKCLDSIPNSGTWNTISSWTYLHYFIDWLLFGFGHPGYKELPPEPQGCKGASMRLYQLFDISYLLMFPYDYFGRILPEMMGKRHKQATGFFPTPMAVSECMSKMINSDSPQNKLDLVKIANEPCVGTGSLLLTQSNYTLCAIGADINLDLLKCALIQFAVYAPWYYSPLWWLGNTDLIHGNSLLLENLESINGKFWLPIFADIVQVSLEPIDQTIYEESLQKAISKVSNDSQSIKNPLLDKALTKHDSAPTTFHQLSLFD